MVPRGLRPSFLCLITWAVAGSFVIPSFHVVPRLKVQHGGRHLGCSCRRFSTPQVEGGVGGLVGQSLPGEVKDSAHATNTVFDALIDQFLTPTNGNLTATVEEYLGMCDYALLMHLNDKIEKSGPESKEGIALKTVGEEINMAMQRRLVAADANLREILSLAPDIKKMEGKVRTLFSGGEVDMAFMVMINMNLEQAKQAEGAGNAVMLLTHLTTFIMGLQDEKLSPEVKLLRVLLRTDCDGVRKSMLLDQLYLPSQELDLMLERPPDKDKVQPELLQKAISDMGREAEELGQAIDSALCESLRGLAEEVNKVVQQASQRPGPFKIE